MKKLLALLLVLAMCMLLLAACSNGKPAESGDNGGTPAQGGESAEGGEPAQGGEPADGGYSAEDVSDITMTFLDINGKGETAGDMVDAVNAITEPELGVHVNFEFIAMGDYANRVTLMISGGETLDIVGLSPIPGASFSTMFSTGQLVDISEYIDAGMLDDAVAAVGSYLDAFRVNGSVYGIPALRNFATGHYLVMRKDILDETGLTDQAQSMTSWPEFEAILGAVNDVVAGSGTYPISKGDAPSVISMGDFESDLSGAFSDGAYYDTLGDSTGALMAYDDGKIISRADSELTRGRMEKLVEWKDKGWIYPDSAYDNQNMGADLLRSNVTFSAMIDSEYGIESSMLAKTNYECVCVQVAPCSVKTVGVNTWGVALTSNAKEPEAAIRFINEMYKNADLMNLLMLGIEGVDYEVTDGVANYVGGDGSTANWHGSDWLFGNQFLVLPFDQTPDYRDICWEQTENAPISPYLGFTLDVSELSGPVASLTAVYDQYNGALNCGEYTEAAYADWASALEAAGVAEYIAAAQAQLDAWQNS